VTRNYRDALEGLASQPIPVRESVLCVRCQDRDSSVLQRQTTDHHRGALPNVRPPSKSFTHLSEMSARSAQTLRRKTALRDSSSEICYLSSPKKHTGTIEETLLASRSNHSTSTLPVITTDQGTTHSACSFEGR
jgi:hypothetical protein